MYAPPEGVRELVKALVNTLDGLKQDVRLGFERVRRALFARQLHSMAQNYRAAFASPYQPPPASYTDLSDRRYNTTLSESKYQFIADCLRHRGCAYAKRSKRANAITVISAASHADPQLCPISLIAGLEELVRAIVHRVYPI
jgi:hypothetical protein